MSNLDPDRLEQIKEDLRKLANGDYYDTSDFSQALCETGTLASELVEEVERLQGNAQAVADLIADTAPFGLEALPHDIMVALRGGPYGSEV